MLELRVLFTILLAAGVIILLNRRFELIPKQLLSYLPKFAKNKPESRYAENIAIPAWKRDNNLEIIYKNPACKIAEAMACSHNYSLWYDKAVIESFFDKNKETNLFKERRYLFVNNEKKLFEFNEVRQPSGELFGFAYDISELEHAENELLKYISAQSDLLANSKNGVAVYSRDKILQFYNNAYAKIWKLPKNFLDKKPFFEDILQKLAEMRMLPEQVNYAQYRQQMIKFFESLTEPHNEFIHLPDGTSLKRTIIPHATGGLIFSFEDITDKLAFERSYNTLVAVQKATLDNLKEGIAVFGQNGRLKMYNTAFMNIWNLAPNLVSGEPHIGDLIENVKELMAYNEDWVFYKNNFVRKISDRANISEVIKRADGKFIELISISLPDGAIFASFRDITDSMILEQNLRHKNTILEEVEEMKAQLLSNISSQIKIPLTTITELSQLMLEGKIGKKQQESFNQIYQSSITLKKLVDDILELTVLQSGFFHLNIKSYNVGYLIDMAKREFDIETADLTNHLVEISIDIDRFKQIFTNLLEYKRQANNQEIMLSVWQNQKEVVFALSSQPVGIDAPAPKELSLKKNAHSEDHFGFAIARSLVKMQHGRIFEEIAADFSRVILYFPINELNLHHFQDYDNIGTTSTTRH